MLVIARRMGPRPDGEVETVIVNERWVISVTGMEVVMNPPPLRLRALKHVTPFRFTVRVVDSEDGTERRIGLFCRHPDDVDAESNEIILKHHGHRLRVFVVRLRGEIVRLGFDGNPNVFTVRRNENPA